YEKIISRLRDAGSVLIVGPGEAKGELKRKFDRDGSNPHVLVVEAADKMTERQLVAYVRRHFQADLTEVEPRKHGRILL
ncbi:MAG TPA: hypothetical protein VGR78_01945, partial [Verrucomicrobiae bacterium]|nr:hypothetical protein [Verrucomicrobiae bacterium]